MSRIKYTIPEPSEYVEVHYGCLTPSGGEICVAYYYDKEGNVCKKEDAYSVNVMELTKDGEYLNETCAILKKA